MNEDFVTFEQAYQLKQLGFDWKCNHIYKNKEHTFFHCLQDAYDNHNAFTKKITDDLVVSAPTLAQAQKWLREVKGCKILITAGDIDKEHYGWDIKYKDIWLGDIDHGNFMESYEEALSNAINEALDIIQEK